MGGQQRGVEWESRGLSNGGAPDASAVGPSQGSPLKWSDGSLMAEIESFVPEKRTLGQILSSTIRRLEYLTLSATTAGQSSKSRSFGRTSSALAEMRLE
jgi:hypothetical protein